MDKVKTFLQERLNLQTAEEKTKLKHATEGTIFLGYEVVVKSGDRIVKAKNQHGTYYRARSYRQRIDLRVPQGKAAEFCHKKGYGDYQTLEAAGKAQWRFRSDVERVMGYNAELRGLANYYSLASNVKTALHKLGYIEWSSLMKTLAGKHQTSVMAISTKLRQGAQREYVCKDVLKGKEHSVKVYQLKHLQRNKKIWQDADIMPNTVWLSATGTEITQRLAAEKCEYCGTEKGYFEVHHSNSRSSPVSPISPWQRTALSAFRPSVSVF